MSDLFEAMSDLTRGTHRLSIIEREVETLLEAYDVLDWNVRMDLSDEVVMSLRKLREILNTIREEQDEEDTNIKSNLFDRL